MSSGLPYTLRHGDRLRFPLILATLITAFIIAITHDGNGLAYWWRRGRRWGWGRQRFTDGGSHDSLSLFNLDGDEHFLLGDHLDNVRATRTAGASWRALDALRSGRGSASTSGHRNSDGPDGRNKGRGYSGGRNDSLDGKRSLGSGGNGRFDVVNHRRSGFVDDRSRDVVNGLGFSFGFVDV